MSLLSDLGTKIGTLLKGYDDRITFLEENGFNLLGSELNPAPNALAIITAGHSQGDGVYWFQNSNINNGNKFQAYCDMTKDGGGWMLALNVRGDNISYMGWSSANIGLRNQTTTPDFATPYSIIDWVDELKRTDGTTWQWMIEANPTDRNTRYYGGGIFHANQSSTFNTTNLQTGVVADEWFPNPAGYYGFITDQGVGQYVPHKGGYNYDAGSGSVFTTDDNDSSWWGCLCQQDGSYSSYHCAPWMSSSYGNIQSPDYVRVWFR